MKKTFLCFIATLLILISGISLVGCDMGTGTPAIPDYNADVQVVEPENIDVVNLKCDSVLVGSLLCESGFFPAYHMSKGS